MEILEISIQGVEPGLMGPCRGQDDAVGHGQPQRVTELGCGCIAAAAWMAWASLCSRSTHLNTSRMLMAGTTRLASASITERNRSANGPLVNISIQPDESTTALG